MNKILFRCSVGQWKKDSESHGLSPCWKKGLRISVMNLAENEFEPLSPTIKMAYQLWDHLPLETNSKGKQKKHN